MHMYNLHMYMHACGCIYLYMYMPLYSMCSLYPLACRWLLTVSYTLGNVGTKECYLAACVQSHKQIHQMLELFNLLKEGSQL